MKEEYLFIGGAKDGEKMEVESNLPMVKVYIKSSERYGITTETYVAEMFHVGGNTFKIFVDSHITINEAFQKLLDNYKP